VNDVPLDQHPGAAIHIYTVRGLVVPVRRVSLGSDVVDQVFADYAVTGLIDRWIGRGVFGADDVDSNIVVVVDDIVREAEICDVSVHHERFAGSRLQMVNFVAVDNKVGDGRFGIRAVHGDAKPVATPSWSVPSRKRLLDMVDVVLHQLNVAACAVHTDAHGSASAIICTIISDFEALNSYVAFVLDEEQRAAPFGSEAATIQNGCLAGITPESHISIVRAAGHVDGDPLCVRSSAHIDRTAGGSRIGGMLNRSPGRLHAAWVRVVARR